MAVTIADVQRILHDMEAQSPESFAVSVFRWLEPDAGPAVAEPVSVELLTEYRRPYDVPQLHLRTDGLYSATIETPELITMFLSELFKSVRESSA